MIHKEGGKFVLRSKKTGRVLGRFDTKKAAEKHERHVKRFRKR